MRTPHSENGKLKILFVSDYPLEEVMGGAVRVVYEQTTGLASRGHEVHLLTRNERFNEAFETAGDVKQWKYATKEYASFLSLKTTISNSRKLFESLPEMNAFNILCFNQPFAAHGILRSEKSRKIRRIYTCHSLSFEEFQSRKSRSGGIARKLQYKMNTAVRRHLEAAVLRQSNAIIALSEYTKEKLCRVHGIPSEKIKIIPAGVDLKRFLPGGDKSRIRQDNKLPSNKVVLLTVRNLVPRMGLENLLVAFRTVLMTVQDIFLVIGGKGPLKDKLIKRAQELGMDEYVKFTGFIPEEDLPDFYRAADLFVVPTRELEGFGLVTLEAMASGLPVLGTPVGGTKEILGKFHSDFLFKSSEPASMARSIMSHYRMIKRDPERWRTTCERCRGFVERNYSWEKNLDLLETVYRQV